MLVLSLPYAVSVATARLSVACYLMPQIVALLNLRTLTVTDPTLELLNTENATQCLVRARLTEYRGTDGKLTICSRLGVLGGNGGMSDPHWP